MSNNEIDSIDNIDIDKIKKASEAIIVSAKKRSRKKPKTELLNKVLPIIREMHEEGVPIKKIVETLASGGLIVSEPKLADFIYIEIESELLEEQKRSILLQYNKYKDSQTHRVAVEIRDFLLENKGIAVTISGVRRFVKENLE